MESQNGPRPPTPQVDSNIWRQKRKKEKQKKSQRLPDAHDVKQKKKKVKEVLKKREGTAEPRSAALARPYCTQLF